MSKEIFSDINARFAAIGSPSDSFQVALDILKENSKNKILGELVVFESQESNHKICSIGQITEVKTINKWHEDPSFKAVIKHHGNLPHLSDTADNRLATLNIQSSFKFINNKFNAVQLMNSPTTGTVVYRMCNEWMQRLTQDLSTESKLEVLGKAHGTDIEIPFHFKHFGRGQNGAGDAYHIGVFGKTGSGKTTTAAKMIAGYATNHQDMSFMILDPQEQFYLDDNLIPNGGSFKSLLIEKGIKEENYRTIKIPEDMALPSDPALFSELIKNRELIRKIFKVTSQEKIGLLSESIEGYLSNRMRHTKNYLKINNAQKILIDILSKFSETESLEAEKGKKSKTLYSDYINIVYSQDSRKEDLVKAMINVLNEISKGETPDYLEDFEKILKFFKTSKDVDNIVEEYLTKKGLVFVINLSSRDNSLRSDHVQGLILQLIISKIISRTEQLVFEGKKVNNLIVLDEAHRYVSANAVDPRLKELNKKIVDSVRTVRKYGIGHMFITQTLESIDNEIIQQMRIYAFGYGLTMGTEFNKLKQIINDDNAAKFYRNFIDPSSNGKYPFMFHGPISPLSFTGSPLFVEVGS